MTTSQQEASDFLDLLIAAMKDAVTSMSLTQIKTQLDPDGKGLRQVRIIVVPEQMEYTRIPGLNREFNKTRNTK